MVNEVRISRTLAATPDEVYDAWTDPAAVMEWMVPIPDGRTEASLEPRVGGRFQIDMFGNGQTYPHRGEYLRLERPRLLEFTWISNATLQQRSVVRVELRSLGDDQTELTLTHKLLPSDEAARQHHDGWSTALDRLADAVARASP